MKKFTLTLFIAATIISSANLFAQNKSYLKDRIMVEGVYKRNIGNFSSVWSDASGAYVSYGIAFPEHNLLIFRSGYISNNLRDGVNYQDASSIIVPLHIGGRYYFNNDRFMPYFTFMNGLNLVFENTNLEGVKEDKTLVKYAWEVGFGLSTYLFSNLIFDVSVNYNSHFYQTDAMMTGFAYDFGLAWALGK